MNKITIMITAATLILGLGLGWLLFHQGEPRKNVPVQQGKTGKADSAAIYTCAMHPQIRQHKPGNCPICGMKLIPLQEASAMANNNGTVEMSPEAMQLANVQTSLVTAGHSSYKDLYLTGKIAVDERRIFEIAAHFHGRIEKLYVNYTGQYVSKGQILASVYSPDLITAEQELLETLPYKKTNPEMYQAARGKLENWKIADSEIDKVEQSGSVMTDIPIRAHRSGYVMKRNVEIMSHVKMGDIMFQMADLSHLWVIMDAYEQDLALIKKGSIIRFTVPSVPDKVYKASVTYIDPFIDPQTRIAEVRAEIDNQNNELKPEMFVRGIVKAKVNMPGEGLLIPQSAVLWTGKRSLVYVKVPGAEVPAFEYREVTLGPEVGDNYIITKGLEQGDEVVTNGTFTIDAAAQLNGKASMMNPEGGATGGDMPGMPGMKMDKGSKGTGSSNGEAAGSLKDQAGIVGKLLGEGCPVFAESSREALRPRMQKLTTTYLDMKNDLVRGDAAGSDKAAHNLLELLKHMEDKGLSKPAQTFLSEQEKLLTGYVNRHLNAGTISGKKLNFAPLSKIMIRLENAFGSGRKLYLTYCFMADNKKGAYWISEFKEIKNPFMPQQMSGCGEVKYVINGEK